MEVNYITEDVKALIGTKSELFEAAHPVEASEVRRFVHATMDQNPRYWDKGKAQQSRYGGVIAPLGFPIHSFRRPPGAPDPLTEHENPNFDGVARTFRPGLPPLPIPLSGVLNGGYEFVFYRHAKHGEKVFRRSAYKDVYQRSGKKGLMVFVILEDLFVDADEKPFLKAIPDFDPAVTRPMTHPAFEDLVVGAEIPTLSKGPLSVAHIMRWSAAMENWHRIHYDWRYATGHDGLPDVLVNGSWKQHVIIQLLSDWVGEDGWVWTAKFQFRSMNVPGDTVTAWGRISGTEVRAGYGVVHLDIGLRNQEDKEAAPGSASVVLPLKGGRPVPYPFDPTVLG